jgi:SAM-dependent methyltransferase
VTLQPGTAAFYDRWAATGREAPRSAISHQFAAAFAPGARVLDVGCGMGRDVVALLDMGFDAYGVEPNDAMRAQALARDPRLGERVAAAALPALGQPFGGGFDAIVCSAVLMHLSGDALPDAFAAFAAVLRPRARVLMALPHMLPALLSEGRDPDGRQFENHAPERVREALAALGFTLLERVELAAPLTDTQWRVLLFGR